MSRLDDNCVVQNRTLWDSLIEWTITRLCWHDFIYPKNAYRCVMLNIHASKNLR